MDLRIELEEEESSCSVNAYNIIDRDCMYPLRVVIPIPSSVSEPVTDSEKFRAYYSCEKGSCDREFCNPENASDHFCWDSDSISFSVEQGSSGRITPRLSLSK
jgi:hypothetical protein